MPAVDHPKLCLPLTHLTHEQIAAMTGTSRVTVTRAHRRLPTRGILHSADDLIVLLNRSRPQARPAIWWRRIRACPARRFIPVRERKPAASA